MPYTKNHYDITKKKTFGEIKTIIWKRLWGRRFKTYKKHSNHKVRQTEVSNGGNYKKVFDYKWTID